MNASTKGYLVPGTIATITVAANAGAQTLFPVSNSPLQIGTKSFKIRKLYVNNLAGGNTLLYIGIGAAGAVVPTMTPLTCLNGIDRTWEEDELQDYEFFADAMIYAATLLAAGNIVAQATVEEIG